MLPLAGGIDLIPFFRIYGSLAQLVEQATLNRQVAGSSPSWPTSRVFPAFFITLMVLGFKTLDYYKFF